MDEFEKLFETTPEEKLIDVLQNAPRGAVHNSVVNFCKEVVALRILLEQNNVSCEQIDRFIFENDALLNEKSNDIFIEFCAKILGHEG